MKRKFDLASTFIAVVIALTSGGSAQGGGLQLDHRSVKSMRDLRDQDLVRQRRDFSCGAAALATLLRYGFGETVTEDELLDDLFALLEEEERDIRRDAGFSLLDLQRVAEARGFRAEGYRLEPADLPRLLGPVIIYIEPKGYPHFAVLRGIAGDHVYLADPSQGNVRMPAYRFLERWVQNDGRGIVFVVELAASPRPAEPVGLPTAKPPHVEARAAAGLVFDMPLAAIRTGVR